MKRILTIWFLAFLIQAQGQGLFEGFQILNIPRETIPLGAEWLNGVGVNGTGLAEDNITINKSINSIELDKTFKQSLDLSILSYFNLGADYLSSTTINYTNLTIYTIKDLSKTNIRTGQLIIYECIKADSIYFKINKSIDSELKLKFDEKLKDLKVMSVSNFKNGVTFSGDKLFIAYRVFEMGKTKVSENEKSIKGPGMADVRLIETKIEDYNINFNDNDFIKCIYPEYPKVINNDKFNECEKKYLIEVEVINFKSQNIQGITTTKRFSIMNSSKTSFTMSERINKDIITDYFEIYYKLQPTLLVGYLKLDENFSKIKLKRITTPLKIFKNPKAPGW